jgi:hypothetical protein
MQEEEDRAAKEVEKLRRVSVAGLVTWEMDARLTSFRLMQCQRAEVSGRLMVSLAVAGGGREKRGRSPEGGRLLPLFIHRLTGFTSIRSLVL